MISYADFLRKKSQLPGGSGFEPAWLPSFLFDFQRHLVEWAIRRGRAAIFADCGLGKTPMQLVWAENVVRKTNRPVLLLAPLAVSAQTVREAEKFGVDCRRCQDGKVPPGARVVTANYERLHYFDPEDFAGVVCDECFPAGTKVQVLLPCGSSGWKYIEDIVPGDRILNASGVDRVKACAERRVHGAVVLRVRGRGITCSENHPFLTVHGWKRARDLRAGDHLVETVAAVRLVRDGVYPEVFGEQDGAFLRNLLLREMADEPPRAQGQGPHGRGACEDRPEGVGVAAWGQRRREATGGAHPRPEPHVRAPVGREDEGDEGAKRHSQGVEGRAWGQRHWADGAGENADRGPRTRVGSVCGPDGGEEGGRLPHPLQGRLRERRSENRHRGGRLLSPLPEGAGWEEGRQAGLARVDGVEVLQQGNPRLERLRDAGGALRFYDLEAERHPSFSVDGLLVHNSSILKDFKAKRKAAVTELLRTRPYRLLCTATAAPNDYVELGTSSEALGELGHQDMLTRFFVKQLAARGTIGWGREKWRMKGHAERDFWRWVCSWARACRKPSDLGFEDGRFVLPPLEVREHAVEAARPPSGYLFDLPAVTLAEQREEQRRTLAERAERVARLVDHQDPAVCWCHLNPEADAIERLVPGAAQVSGADPEEAKEEKLLAFASGQVRVLVTKPRIAGHGLNWQHCAHQTYFPSHSFEQWYQGVRRCWRFGQTRPVVVDVVTTRGGAGVMASLRRKADGAERMFARLVALMNDAQRVHRTGYGDRKEEVPPWMTPSSG